MCVQVHLCPSVQLRRQLGRVLYEPVASRADVVSLLVPGAVDVVARLREAVVNRDPLRADVGNRRLDPLARTFLLCGGRRLQPLEVGVPAAELVLDGGRERRPLFGDVCEQCVLGRPRASSSAARASPASLGAAARTDDSSRCSASRCRRIHRHPQRHLYARRPAAGRSGGGRAQAVLDRGCAHVRASCWSAF